MKKENFNFFEIIDGLVGLGERQLEAETKAADFIEGILTENKIAFTNNHYAVQIPKIVKAKLVADGLGVPCLGSCFNSGTIDSSSKIISSLEPSIDWSKTININYNPDDENFSRPDFYFAPALTVKRGEIDKLKNAKEIIGEVKVIPTDHQSRDILVGNKINPEYLLFAHYDSVGPGAVDNAGGVSVLIKLVLERADLLNKCLVVFAANEELSYDWPVYWGHGFREFEKKNNCLLKNAKNILVVDGPGNGRTSVINDSRLLKLAFPIASFKKMIEKTTVISGDYDNLMRVYHGEDDLQCELDDKYLKESFEILCQLIK